MPEENKDEDFTELDRLASSISMAPTPTIVGKDSALDDLEVAFLDVRKSMSI